MKKYSAYFALFTAAFVLSLLLHTKYHILTALAQTANNYLYLNGNVGIGTSSPTKKLDVSGDTNITGNLNVTGQVSGAGMTMLADTLLTSASSNITFSNIPQNYKDLEIILSGQSTANQWAQMQFNNDTGNNYDDSIIYAGNTWGLTTTPAFWEATGHGSALGPMIYYSSSSASAGGGTITIRDYTSTTLWKVITGVSTANSYNSTGTGTGIDIANIGDIWHSTSAINSISISIWDNCSTCNFKAGTRATLYGLR